VDFSGRPSLLKGLSSDAGSGGAGSMLPRPRSRTEGCSSTGTQSKCLESDEALAHFYAPVHGENMLTHLLERSSVLHAARRPCEVLARIRSRNVLNEVLKRHEFPRL